MLLMSESLLAKATLDNTSGPLRLKKAAFNSEFPVKDSKMQRICSTLAMEQVTTLKIFKPCTEKPTAILHLENRKIETTTGNSTLLITVSVMEKKKF